MFDISSFLVENGIVVVVEPVRDAGDVLLGDFWTGPNLGTLEYKLIYGGSVLMICFRS